VEGWLEYYGVNDVKEEKNDDMMYDVCMMRLCLLFSLTFSIFYFLLKS